MAVEKGNIEIVQLLLLNPNIDTNVRDDIYYFVKFIKFFWWFFWFLLIDFMEETDWFDNKSEYKRYVVINNFQFPKTL